MILNLIKWSLKKKSIFFNPIFYLILTFLHNIYPNPTYHTRKYLFLPSKFYNFKYLYIVQENNEMSPNENGYKPRKDNNAGGGYGRRKPQGGGGYKRGPKPTGERSMYYITLLCPPEIDEPIGAHKEMMRENFGCVVAAKSPAHLTLIAPFFLSDGKYRELLERMAAFESIVSEVEVNVEGYNHFGERVIFADVHVNDNMVAMQEQLENYLRNGGFPFIKEAKKPFHPHITIATRDLKDTDFVAAWANFEGKQISSSFTTNTFHLMKLVDERWVHDQQFIL
jgi:2'-5' RNA ligase